MSYTPGSFGELVVFKVVVYKIKTWKQKFLVIVYISLTAAFRYRGKGHLAYYMRILHVAFLRSIFQLSPRKGLVGFLRRTLTMHR